MQFLVILKLKYPFHEFLIFSLFEGCVDILDGKLRMKINFQLIFCLRVKN